MLWFEKIGFGDLVVKVYDAMAQTLKPYSSLHLYAFFSFLYAKVCQALRERVDLLRP